MREINTERFFAAYDELIRAKEEKLATKDQVIEAEKVKAENVVATNGYSDAVKELLIKEIVAEKEKEFDTVEDDAKIAEYAQFIDFTEDVVEEEIHEEHPADCECEECVAKRLAEQQNIENV